MRLKHNFKAPCCVADSVRRFWFLLMFVCLCAAHARAQCSSVPANFSEICGQLQGYLTSFNGTLASQWDGSRWPVSFNTNLLSADDNGGLQRLLDPTTLAGVERELDGMVQLGMQSVNISVGFPLLYQPFYQWNNDPQDYQTVLSFYQSVLAAARQRGLKVLIESSVVFPSTATDVPLTQYYATLSDADVTTGRTQVALTIAEELQPDWLDLGSEPDTQSLLLGRSAEYTPAEYASLISSMVSTLRNAGIKGKPLLGAGCGAWQQNGSDYVQALIPTGIDYFDMHVYSVNMGYLNAGVSYLDQAIAAGLGGAISETWMHKMTDAQLQGKSEFGVLGVLSGVVTEDDYSFWAPIDSEFIGTMVDLAYWKHLLYLSPFEGQLFFAYLDYSQVASLNPTQLMAQEDLAEVIALNSGAMSFTGEWAGDYVRAGAPATGSSASGASPVAPGSIVSIYGASLASTAATAKSVPLPLSLGGASGTITDSSGVQTPLPLFYAGPLQINAQIPQNASVGAAILTLNTPSGTQTGAVLLATVAPALFAVNQNGKGVVAGEVVTNHSNGTQTSSLVYGSPCAIGKCEPIPIDLSEGKSALVLYGTGIRNAASLSDVSVMIGGQKLSVFFAGPAPNYVGLDQVNVLLPQSLAGSGTVNVVVTVAGAASNTVQVAFK